MRTDRLVPPLLLAGVMLALGGCSSGLEPVDIFPDDMCSACKMAISDKRFAGEILWQGTARKFDDLGCMVRTIQKGGDRHSGFVVDFGSREWVNAKEAYYVRSTEISTPMRSGLIAFKDREAAQQAASKYAGQVLNYDDVFGLPGK
ncbi:MAG: hypothetical protein EHM61_23555 [Acidobacteria bacterium]|nr:MAG: hypothetical protein EHM61_23555 [Acidobacteriota bacterium]